MRRLKLAVLISGRGSNMGALAQAAVDPSFSAELVSVISNKPNAGGLALAREYNIPTLVVDQRDYDSREAHEDAVSKALEAANPDLICLAGYMRILTEPFVNRWQGKLINIHPSLLPAFRGVDTHPRALEAGVRFHGCSVHFVTPELDAGPIIAQAAVAVSPEDTEESLSKRVLKAEHVLYPKAVDLIARGNVRWQSDGTLIFDEVSERELSIWMNG